MVLVLGCDVTATPQPSPLRYSSRRGFPATPPTDRPARRAAARQKTPQVGLNLAKGYFLAKHSHSAVQSREKSAPYMYQHARNAAQDGQKIRPVGRERSFGRLRGVTPDKSAVEMRQMTQSKGQSELLVHTPTSVEESLRGYLATFWGFARWPRSWDRPLGLNELPEKSAHQRR
jgi:hypothetical protein